MHWSYIRTLQVHRSETHTAYPYPDHKVDMIEGLVGEILGNPALGAMHHHIFVMSKAEDQVGFHA